jgi:hypothetical protein
MKYKVSVIKNISRSILLALLIGNVYAPLHAAAAAKSTNFTVTNYGEIITALATLPIEIAARTCDTEEGSTTASVLHLTATTLNISNKVFSLYNNIQAQNIKGNLTWKNKECIVQSSFLIRDLTKFYTHCTALIHGKTPANDLETKEEDDDFDLDVLPSMDEKIAQEISTLAHAWRRVGIPTLKSLTALAVACTQDYATRYSGQEAHSVALASCSLVRLLDEYNELRPNSSYKEIVAALLFINVAWLVYEIKNYNKQPKMQHQNGNCAMCSEDDQDLLQLHCGHRFCKTCLTRYVGVQYTDRGPQFDRTPCPHVGPPQPGAPAGLPCRQHLTRNEIKEITDNDFEKLKRFDGIIGDRLKTPEGRADAAILRDIQLRGGMQCPRCRAGVIKRDIACDHITCACGNQFCYRCGNNWVRTPGWNHPNTPCVDRPHYHHHDPFLHITRLLN